MRSEAIDCPFCGSPAKVWTRISRDMRVNRDMERTTVLCTACGCRTLAFVDRDEAIAAWNRRYNPERKSAPKPRSWRHRVSSWFGKAVGR